MMNKAIEKSELDFLLRFPVVINVVSPVDFLSNWSWGGVKALSNLEQFRNLDKDIEVKTDMVTHSLCVSVLEMILLVYHTFHCANIQVLLETSP